MTDPGQLAPSSAPGEERLAAAPPTLYAAQTDGDVTAVTDVDPVAPRLTVDGPVPATGLPQAAPDLEANDRVQDGHDGEVVAEVVDDAEPGGALDRILVSLYAAAVGLQIAAQVLVLYAPTSMPVPILLAVDVIVVGFVIGEIMRPSPGNLTAVIALSLCPAALAVVGHEGAPALLGIAAVFLLASSEFFSLAAHRRRLQDVIDMNVFDRLVEIGLVVSLGAMSVALVSVVSTVRLPGGIVLVAVAVALAALAGWKGLGQAGAAVQLISTDVEQATAAGAPPPPSTGSLPVVPTHAVPRPPVR